MGMGGFILTHEGCRVIPVVFDAKFKYTKVENGTTTIYDGVMKQEHFDLKTCNGLEGMENVKKFTSKTSKRTISENEIMNQSNDDALAKTFALFQLMWFSIQLVARVVWNLHTTPLEITTIAYIVVAAILYLIWWKKPKDIRYPICVTLTEGDHQEMYRNVAEHDQEPDEGNVSANLIDFLLSAGVEDYDITTSLAVPEFYSGKVYGDLGKEDYAGIAAEMALGCIFGMIHCLAWYEFQTDVEPVIWRVSSVVVCIVPFMIAVCIPLSWVWEDVIPRWLLVVPFMIFFFVICFGSIAYVLARLSLMALAFSSLHNLPEEALRLIPWTSILPHFG
jgi:hypothetical protein